MRHTDKRMEYKGRQIIPTIFSFGASPQHFYTESGRSGYFQLPKQLFSRTLAPPWILHPGTARSKTPFSLAAAPDFPYFDSALDTPSRHSQIENSVFICRSPDFPYFGSALDTPSRHSQIENSGFIYLCPRLSVLWLRLRYSVPAQSNRKLRFHLPQPSTFRTLAPP